MHVLAVTGLFLLAPAVVIPVMPAPVMPAPVMPALQDPEPVLQVELGTIIDDLFAAATEGLALSWPEESGGAEGFTGLTMLDIVNAYGAATGQRLSINHDTRMMLEQTQAPLDRATSVPSSEVQGFVESLLRSADCVMTVDRARAPRLVGIHSLRTQDRSSIRSRSMNIASDQIDVLRDHPAVIFSTVLDLPHSDVRQMSNSMRTIITDANTQQLLPAGNSSSIILVGFGPNLADLIEQLRAVDAASATASVSVSHELIRLKNATASDIAALVEIALRTSRDLRTERSQSSGPRQESAQLTVLADTRLNGLLVTCRSEDLAAARDVIAQLDVE